MYVNSKYFVIDKIRKNFITLDEVEFEHCKFVLNYYICNQLSPLYSTYSHENCELDIFMQKYSLLSNCDKRLVKLNNNLWYPLPTLASWIFICVVSESVTVNCNDLTFDLKLNKTGIFKLENENCKAYTSFVELQPKRVRNNTLVVDFIPELNISKFNISKYVSFLENNSINSNMSFKYKHISFDNINEASHRFTDLDKSISNSEHYNDHSNVTLQHSYMIYIILALVIIILLFLIISKIKKYCKNLNLRKPESKSEDTVNIELNVGTPSTSEDLGKTKLFAKKSSSK